MSFERTDGRKSKVHSRYKGHQDLCPGMEEVRFELEKCQRLIRKVPFLSVTD